MNYKEKHTWDDIQNRFNSELEVLLEKAMPDIGEHLNTFILEPICVSTREKLDINIIFRREKHEEKGEKTVLLSDEYFTESVIKRLLDNVDICATFQENKSKYIEKLEQARDIKKLKKALKPGGLSDEFLSIAHETLFSVHQSPQEIFDFRELKIQGMNNKQLKQAYIDKTIANERKILISYFTTSNGFEKFDYEDITEQIQKYEICIIIKKIKPLLQILLEQFYDEKQVFFFSEIAEVDGQYVIFGVSINETYCQTHREVFYQNNAYMPDEYESFILQIINVTLEKWREYLQHKLFYTTSECIMDYNATLQLAARDVTEGRGLPSYSYFNLLSSMLHESSSCCGQIVFLTKNEDKDGLKLIKFDELIQFSYDNIRYIRKLLEISSDKYYLACFEKNIIGIAEIMDTQKLHILKFDGFMKWTLEYNNIQLVSYDKERLFYKTDTFKKQIENMLQSKKLKDLIRILCEQKHGTMVIVFKDASVAQSEIERLSSYHRGLQLEIPYDLSVNNEVALKLSSIDGALIIDEKCMCYGIGVIVDGKACVHGTQSRGSRYNSAKNYVKYMTDEKNRCFCCVISEDGTLNIITDKQCIFD